MKLNFIGTLVRAGIVVIGGSAVVLVAAENLFLSKNDEMLVYPVSSTNVPVSEGISDITSESDFKNFSESSVFSSNQGSVFPQSSFSVSAEIKVEPTEITDNSEWTTQSESYISEPSSIPQSSEMNKPQASSVTVSTGTSSVTEISSLEIISDISSKIPEEPPVSTASTTTSDFSSDTEEISSTESSSGNPELSSSIPQSSSSTPQSSSSTPQSSLSTPQSSSSTPQSSSTKPEQPESSMSTITESTKPPIQDDIPILPEPDEPDIVNINTASVEELKTLWGIDNVKAEAIIAYRERYGDFVSIYDIRRVDGIADIVFEGIRDYITV